MSFIPFPLIPEVIVHTPEVYWDTRGYFVETYHEQRFLQTGIKARFVQDNQSFSTYGVLRGLHYQEDPFAQAKLVRVISGEIFDVAVDIRQGSPTFGKWVGEILSAENRKQMFIPRGFAHGFVVLSKEAIVFYKCDNFYSKPHEKGIRYDDPTISIRWPLPENELILSEKDKNLPFLEEVTPSFDYKKQS